MSMLKLLLLSVMIAWPTGLLAQKVSAELLTDHTTVTPGRPFKAGILLRIEPGYHIYWKYPGDSGLPTRVTWMLPPGFTASDLSWPVPEHFDQAGGIEGIGYEGQVMLLADITPPADFKGQVPMQAEVRWLVCRDTCTPGKATVAATIEVVTAMTPANHDLFAKWLARIPRPAADLVRIKRQEGRYLIDADFPIAQAFIAPPTGFSAEKPEFQGKSLQTTLTPLAGAGTANQTQGEVVLVFGDASRPAVHFTLPR